MYTLALAEIQQLLAVVICDLGSLAYGVRPVCLEVTEREVCGEQSVPLGVELGLAKLNHAYQMALDVAAHYKPHEGSTGKPAVYAI